MVLHDDTARATTVAGGAAAGGIGQFHEVFIPRRALVSDLLQHFLYLAVEILDSAAIVEAEVGLADANAEVLLVGVGIVHLALLVGDEGLVGDMVGLGATQHGALVAHLWVGVDSEEVETGLATQCRHLAGGAHTLDDAVAARG